MRDALPVDGLAAPLPTDSPPAPGGLQPVPPLEVSGIMVTRAALVAALRIYVPQLIDISELDSERFLLTLPTTVPSGGDQP